MVRIDTLKMDIPTNLVNRVKWDAFIHTDASDMGTGQAQTYRKAKSRSLPAGISSISWQDGGQFQVTFSAKTLKDNYLDGININTFPQALASFSPIMDIDINRVWDSNPKIYLLDTTDNVPLDMIGETHLDICNALLASRTNLFFEPKIYNTRKKLGVEFHGRQLEKNRLIAYAKHLDLLKPTNKKFIATLSNASRMFKDAENIIRIETNHTTFRSIRNRLKVNTNNLQEVLKSSQPVNYDFLVKVLMGKSGNQMQLFDELKAFDGSFDEFVMLKGIETIINSFDANDVMVKQFFKCGFQHNFNYHYYKKKNSIKQLLAKAKANKYQTTTESCNTISSKVLTALKQLAA